MDDALHRLGILGAPLAQRRLHRALGEHRPLRVLEIRVLAQRAGQELELFDLEKYNIPYGYSPILLAHPSMLSDENGAVHRGTAC